MRYLPLAAALLLAPSALAPAADAGPSGGPSGAPSAKPIADPAPWVLPVNAFAKAKPGDWTILEGDAVLGGKSVHEREIIRVGPVARGVAEVQLFEGPAGKEGWFLSFPVDVKRGPDTNLLYDLPWIANGLAQAKATCTLGTASFPCTQVTYATASHQVTVMMAPRVLGSGIVSFAIAAAGQPVWTMKTIGYGNGAKVEWGAGPPRADLQANWDGGASSTAMREGSEPAAPDQYEEDLAPLGQAPRADLGDCQVIGDVDKGLITRYVLRELRPIEDCYIALVTANRRLGGGTVELSFTIDENAHPVDFLPEGTAVEQIRTCVTGVLEHVQFPISDSGAPQQLRCNFTFDPGKPAPPHKPHKPKLLRRGHPARGGPDIRGVQRIP
ncbi:MAG TPA: hypothetical protein VHE35_35230 [Kofleriaceae bacterium]|nr:hypothetical protein [Kofleriaceae bacterium]